MALSNGHPDGNLYRGAYLGNIGVEVVGRLDHGVIQIRRSVSTAKVKGEKNQEKHRWFGSQDQARSEGHSYPATIGCCAEGMEREMPIKPAGIGIL